MKTRGFIESGFCDLEAIELQSIYGGEPTKSTGFYYDLFYTVSHVVGSVYREFTDPESLYNWSLSFL